MAEETCFDALDSGAGLSQAHAIQPTPSAWTYSLSAHTEPQWLDQAIQRIDALRRLAINWDTYGGVPVRLQVLTAATDMLRDLARPKTPPPSVVPTSDGSVQLEWHTRGIDLEVRWLSPVRVHVYLDDAHHALNSLDDELLYDLLPLRKAIRALTARN